MAITVKHSKVSTIPDEADTSLVRPSDWNADHVLTGTIPIINGGTGQTTANLAFNALAPSQTGNTGKYLTTDGTDTSWSANPLGDVVGPASATDNAVARFDTTTGKLIQNSVTLIDDTGNASGILSQQFSNGSAVTLSAGKIWYDGSTGSWNAGMGNGNITQQIGEELFVYGKASSAITDSPLQIIYHTGTVGASGVITFAPTIAGITDENAIIGVATENIALNGFGRVTTFGVVRGITTNGTAFGETWADDDVIWYNPVTGNPTKVKPSAPNIKFQIGLVIKAGSGGSGSFQVALVQGTELGGTDSNVKLTSPTNGNILTYDGGNGYWKNTDLTAGTGISVSKSVNGVLTVTNTSPSSGGTVTSVTGTSPVVSSGGNTPAISMPAATTSVNGYLTSTDWNSFNNKVTMTYPSAGIANSTGTAWGTSYGVTGTGNVVLDTRPTMSVTGAGFTLQDATDNTKQANFVLSGITTATTGLYTLPAASTTLAGLGTSQTFTATNTFSNTTTFSGNVSMTSSSFTRTATTQAWLDGSMTTATWIVGGTAQTGAITLGRSTNAQTLNLATGATTTATTKTVNIGTNGVSGSTTTMIIGSSVSGATTTVGAYGTWTFNTPLANTNLANSAITINGTSTSLGGSINVGTVTSVAALTLGTTGTDLSSTVATDTTTPVITLNVPTASATNRGALSSTDWTTFNNKGSGTVSSVALTAPAMFTITGSPVTSSGTLALTYSGTALPILNGGTGQTTANAAFNALAPTQTSNSGKYLTTDGTNTSWATVASGSNAYTRTSFTATASQTTFTATYTVGYIQVFVNGVFLNDADYTATNGTSVVLAVACNVGDIVETIAFTTFSVANTVSSFSGGTTGLTPSTATTGVVTLAGTLAVANGGTGVTTSTGSGAVVLGTSPTIATATLTTPTITSLYGQNSNLVTTPYNGTGLIPGELIYRLNSTSVGANVSTVQSVFGVGVSVSASTQYQFEGVYALSKSAGTTLHTLSYGFGGTATLNNIAYTRNWQYSGTSFTAPSVSSTGFILQGFVQTATLTSLTSNEQTNAAASYWIVYIRGTVSINAAGTFIPQYQLSAAPGGAYTTAIGSYFKLSPMSASGSNTSIGTWA